MTASSSSFIPTLLAHADNEGEGERRYNFTIFQNYKIFQTLCTADILKRWLVEKVYERSDEIVNLFKKVSENESDDGELACSNLHSDENIKLSESDCEESEESADIIDNIPVNPDIYVAGDGTE
ncbi:uncharacterized protein TNCV_1684571 [Trichonephila clavipes]|nr:uncharacterized protein TNCV_1684571 [Trichonephila clavipes]